MSFWSTQTTSDKVNIATGSGNDYYLNGFDPYSIYPSLYQVDQVNTGPNTMAYSINNNIDFVDINSSSNNNVTMSSLTGTMTLDLNNTTSSPFATYDIVIWAASNDSDSVITSGKIRWESTLTLTQAGPIGTGIFASGANCTYSHVGNHLVVTYNLSSTQNIVLDSNEIIEIATFAHTGLNYQGQGIVDVQTGIAEDIAKDRLKKLGLNKIEIYPNPLVDQQELNLIINPVASTNYKIILYDISGRFISIIHEGILPNNEERKINYRLPDISSGTYQIVIQSNAGQFALPFKFVK